MLEDASGRPLNEIEDIKIIVTILDIFRLLPASANIFMDEVIRELIIMESRLHRSYSSPFRPPVIRYLNRYASEAIDYFYERILEPKFSAIFISLLQSDLASVLRLEVMKTHQKLLSNTLSSTKGTDDEIRERQKQGVRILHQIMKQQPEWHEPDIIAPLKAVWVKSLIGDDGRSQSLSELFRNSSQVLDILMTLSQQDPDDVSLLFEIVNALERDDILDHSELKIFLFTHFQDRMSNSAKKASLEKFFVVFASDVVSQQTKTNIIRFLVVPMLLLSIQKDPSSIQEIVDVSMVELMQNRIWAPLSSENDETASEDALKVELLQLTVLLIQYVPEAISDIRKDIIKFAWKHFKIEDTITKQSAYVVLARFIREYDTPVKIVVQIYVALLRAFQAEGKVLVKQALDILLPVLPQRITDAGGDSKMATWVRWTRKIIIEDGHNTPQLVMIYQLIIRHAEQFYESRDHFIPQIVFSLAKLGLSPNATSETRTLTMDIAEVLLTWERKAIEETDEKDEGEFLTYCYFKC